MLEGMRVASFTHWLQGPATTQYLADMGADVMKVERTEGSYERSWHPANRSVAGIGTLHFAANRNARSLALDLKKPGAVDIALRLVESCDVVVENYRPGVMDRLGLGYEAVRARKPEIIYASATGYGPDGPLSKGPGQDLLVQARAGMVAATGEAGVRPTPIGNSAIDQHGAALLALGIVGAYVKRLQTGRGTRVEGSLYNAVVDLMMEGLTHYFSGGHTRESLRRDHHLSTWYLGAPYGTYRLKDAFIVISINPLPKLAEALESEALAALNDIDPFERRDEYARALASELEGRTFAEVKERFDRHGLWYERVQDFDDMRTDPQAAYAQIFRKVPVGGAEVTVVNHPNRYDGEPPPFRSMPVAGGEHSQEVLMELGYGAAEIESFVTAGVVAIADEP